MAHGADFVQKQCAAVGYFEQTFLGRDCAGECSFDVSEERGLEQVRGHGAGVHRNKRTVAPRRV